jgi:two-component system LytT family response regulator
MNILALGDYVVHKSLTAITEELPQLSFLRIHRSYTISINKIISLEGNTIEISSKKIPIGRNYIKITKERIFNINDENKN